MSALTKTFVVLLVVMSLLSAAGFIVFVNRVDNFKTSMATSNAALTQSQADVATAKAQAAALLAQLAAARRDARRRPEGERPADQRRAAEVATLNATIAQDASRARITASRATTSPPP